MKDEIIMDDITIISEKAPDLYAELSTTILRLLDIDGSILHGETVRSLIMDEGPQIWFDFIFQTAEGLAEALLFLETMPEKVIPCEGLRSFGVELDATVSVDLSIEDNLGFVMQCEMFTAHQVALTGGELHFTPEAKHSISTKRLKVNGCSHDPLFVLEVIKPMLTPEYGWVMDAHETVV